MLGCTAVARDCAREQDMSIILCNIYSTPSYPVKVEQWILQLPKQLLAQHLPLRWTTTISSGWAGHAVDRLAIIMLSLTKQNLSVY